MSHEPETYEFQQRCIDSLKPWHADVLFEFDALVRANRYLSASVDEAEKRGRANSPYAKTHELLVRAYTDGWSHVQLARVGQIIEEVEAEIRKDEGEIQ